MCGDGNRVGTAVATANLSPGNAPRTVIFDDKTNSATPAEMAAINAFNERIEAEGHWVFAGGFNSPSTATVIDNLQWEALFTDGPFLETKETSPACGSSGPPTSTWRSSSPPRGRRPAIGRSRYGHSTASERDRRPGGDHRSTSPSYPFIPNQTFQENSQVSAHSRVWLQQGFAVSYG